VGCVAHVVCVEAIEAVEGSACLIRSMFILHQEKTISL
jgi:hypothetical protein